MTIEEIVRTDEYKSVIADYKDTCLWSATGYDSPCDKSQLDYLLTCIETYGDLSAFKRIGKIRQWLSPRSSPAYSGSSPVRA